MSLVFNMRRYKTILCDKNILYIISTMCNIFANEEVCALRGLYMCDVCSCVRYVLDFFVSLARFFFVQVIRFFRFERYMWE